MICDGNTLTPEQVDASLYNKDTSLCRVYLLGPAADTLLNAAQDAQLETNDPELNPQAAIASTPPPSVNVHAHAPFCIDLLQTAFYLQLGPLELQLGIRSVMPMVAAAKKCQHFCQQLEGKSDFQHIIYIIII